MNRYQQQYWRLLVDLKTQTAYLHYYAIHSERWDRIINIIVAVTSSASIATWAVWQKYQIVWAFVIAASHVIVAVKPYLPFRRRLKPINNLNDKIKNIALECERHWYQVSKGDLTEGQINDLFFGLKKRSLEAEQEDLRNINIPKKNRLLKKAEEETDDYLKNFYHLK